MSNIPGVFLEVAYQDDAFFTGSKKGDVAVRTAIPSQQMMFGTRRDVDPVFAIGGSNMFVNGNIGVGAYPNPPIEAFDVQQGNAFFNSNIYVMENVGLGTTTPMEALDVQNGNGKFASNIYVIGAASIGMTSSNPSENVEVGSNVKVNSNVYAMQRIGVSTSNPTEALHVVGSGKISSNVYILSNLAVGSSNPRESVDIASNAIIRKNAYVLSNMSIGSGNSNPTQTLDVYGNAKVNGLMFVTSNIGVGTLTPSERLDVFDNSKFRGNVYALSAMSVGASFSNPTEILDVRGNTKISSNLYVTNVFGLGTSNPSEKADIIGNTKVTGNVYATSRISVGNSNPSERIDVTGNILASSNMYALNSIGVGTVFPSERVESTANIKALSNMYALSRIGIGHSNPEERLHVATGNVKFDSNAYVMGSLGVGKSNPSEKVDIIGNVKVSGDIYVASNVGFGLSNPSEQIESTKNLKIGSNLYVVSRIGVNTSNPTERIDVMGNIKASSNIYSFNALAIGSSNPTEKADIIGHTKISSNLYVLSNIAIAHSNPTEKLDIVGNLRTSSNAYIMNALSVNTSNPQEIFDVNGTAKVRSNMYILSNIAVAHSNPTEKVDVIGNLKTSSNIYAMSKLGVATSNPAVGLEVNTTDAVLLSKGTTGQRPSVPVLGHVRYNTDLNLFEGYGAGNAWGSLGGVKSTDQQTFVAAEMYPTSNDGNIRFVNNGTESMRITTARNVGIGTSNPNASYMLHVKSNVAAQGTTVAIENSNSTGWAAFAALNSTSTTSGGARIGITGSNWTPTGYFLSNAGFVDTETPNGFSIAANNAQGQLRFYTGGTTERMRINSNGNVGIATTNTGTYRVEVNGSIYATGYCNLLVDSYASTSTYNAPTAAALKFAADTAIYTSNILFLSSSNGGTALAAVADYGSNTSTWASNNLVKRSGDSMTGTLTAPNVGVNTAAPSERLEVTGNAKVSSNMYVMNNLGIGTSNIMATSNYRLQVIGNARIEGNLDVNGIYNIINTDVRVTDQFTISNDGTGPALKVHQMGTQAIADFYDDSNVAMRIADGGLVGVGTSNPVYRLDVAGDLRVGNAIGANYNLVSDGQLIIWGNRTGNNTYVHTAYCVGSNNNSTGDHVFYTRGNMFSGTERMRITSAGSVGIGTSSPSFALEVNGYTGIKQTYFYSDSQPYGYPTTNRRYALIATTSTNSGFVRIEGISGGHESLSANQGKCLFDVMIDSRNGTVRGNVANLYGNNAAGIVVYRNTDASFSIYVTGGAYYRHNIRISYGDGTTANSSLSWSTDTAWTQPANTTLWFDSVTHIPASSLGNDFYMSTAATPVYGLTTLTNGYVGVNNSNPSNPLDVNGNARVTGTLQVSGTTRSILPSFGPAFRGETSSTNGVYLSLNNVNSSMLLGVDGVGYANISPNAALFGSWSNYPTIFATNATERMRIDTAGNVGIGTTSPIYKLDVNGNTRLNNAVVGDSGNGAAYAGFMHSNLVGISTYGVLHQNNGNLFLNTATGMTMFFRENNADRMVLSNAMLGVGTSSPAYKLDVIGETTSRNANAFRCRSTAYSTILRNDNSDFYILNTAYNDPDGTWNARRPMQVNFSSGTVYLGNQALTVQDAGNVGIGTLSPSYKLDVAGSAMFGSSATFGQRIGLTDYEVKLFGSGVKNYSIFNSNGVFSIADTSTNAAFGTAGTQLMCLSNALLGLGTSSPSYKLDVSGQGRFTSGLIVSGQLTALNSANQYAAIVMADTSDSTTTGNIFGDYNNNGQLFVTGRTNSAKRLALGYDTVNNAGVVQAIESSVIARPLCLNSGGGNVGVGTINPSYKLDVNGVARTTTLVVDSLNNTGFFRNTTSAGVNYIQSGLSNANNSAAPLVFTTINVGAEWARFDASGNFGIGTVPSYKLDVAGNARVTGSLTVSTLTGYAYGNGTGAMTASTTIPGSAITGNILGNAANVTGTVAVANGGTGATSLTASKLLVGAGIGAVVAQTNLHYDSVNSRLGVSTASPSYTLDVNGSLNATNVYQAGVAVATTSTLASYLPLSGGTMTGSIALPNTGGITWSGNSDGAAITFNSTGDGTGLSYLEIKTTDNGDEPIIFKQTNTERMRVHTNGSIGIATPTPSSSYALDVAGGMNATTLYQNGTSVSTLINNAVSGAYLPLSGGNMSGNVSFNNYGTCYIGNGNADNATMANYNLRIRSWWGIGFPSYDDVNRILFDTRTGNITTLGYLDAVTLKQNGTALAASATTDTTNAGNITSGTLAVARGGTGATSLTANKLLVGAGTSAITAQTNLHYDSINSRLGVLTASPAYNLDVFGTARFSGNVVMNGSDFTVAASSRGVGGRALVHDTGNVLTLNYQGDFSGGTKIEGTTSFTNSVSHNDVVYMKDKALYMRNDTGHGVIYNATIDGPRLWGVGGGYLGAYNGTNCLTWGSNGNVIINAGSLGVGTTTPQYTVDVNGIVKTNTAFRADVAAGGVYYGATVNNANVNFGSGAGIQLSTGPSNSALFYQQIVNISQNMVGMFLSRAYSTTNDFTCSFLNQGSIVGNWNSFSPAVFNVNKDNGNSRSINAAGTINASGADYAEYMVKADSNVQISKGDIVGFDANGKLTTSFTEAISFGIKSTDPCMVGGDTWGNHIPAATSNATPEELQAWKDQCEQARAAVDRIAFCGRTPVNVQGAKPGEYIVAVAGSNDIITGSNMPSAGIAFSDYQRAVGKVLSVLDDGRAEVIVMFK